MHNKYDAVKTATSQLITMIISLLVGISIIASFMVWTRQWNIHYSDGSTLGFTLGAGFSGIALLVLTIGINLSQFENALTVSEVFHLGIAYSFVAIKIMSIPAVALNVLFLIAAGSFVGFVIEIFGTVALLFILGAVIGGIHAASLVVRGFDATKHVILISNDSDIEASKMGKLPYRQQVYLILQIAGMSFMLLIWGVGVWIAFVEAEMFMTLLLGAGVGIAGAVKLVDKLRLLISNRSKMRTVQGKISKSMKKEYAPHVGQVRTYYLACNGQKYIADGRVWTEVEEDKEYTLWIATSNKEYVIAFEDLP
jgi:hypothetical protein